MRDPYYGRMCFKSVKTLGAVHYLLWKKLRPLASAFFTAKNVQLLGLYPIRYYVGVKNVVSHINTIHQWEIHVCASIYLDQKVIQRTFEFELTFWKRF